MVSSKAYRRGALGIALLSAVAGFGAAWPVWADQLVQQKVEHRLKDKFDHIEIETFDLERNELILTGVTLQQGELALTLDSVHVDFETNWGLKIDVSDITITGGLIRGPLSEMEDLLLKEDALPTGEGRVSLADAEVTASGISVELHDGNKSIHGLASATLEEGGVEASLENGIVRMDDFIGTFTKTSTFLRRDRLFPLVLTLEGLETEITPEIELTAIQGTVTLHDLDLLEEVGFELEGMPSDTGGAREPWTAHGILNRGLGKANIDLGFGALEVGDLPIALEKLPVTVSPETALEGDIHITWEDDKATITGRVFSHQGTISHPSLATTPVEFRNLDLDLGKVLIDPKADQIHVTDMSLQRAGVTVDLSGSLTMVAQSLSALDFHLRLHGPHGQEASCEDFLQAFPPDLVPGLQGFSLVGGISADLKVRIIPDRPEDTVFIATVENDCEILDSPKEIQRLSGSFTHRVRSRTGATHTLALAEGSFNFVPLEKIAPTMMAAVVTTEDGGFWKHNGFLRSQFESSLRRNVELGMIRRGASTITMQLVKNLLLSHERTVSRKLQELFLTWVLEQKLSKQRIMEIYLNIVEFGPGIYGIERASRHYFGKPPMDLTGKESAFLATMLPNPVGRHSQWCRGELTEKYAKKVDRVFQFMHDRNRIDDLTWETEKDLPLVFSKTEWSGEAACMAERQTFLSATGVQWAENGLLEKQPKLRPSLEEEFEFEDNLEDELEP